MKAHVIEENVDSYFSITPTLPIATAPTATKKRTTNTTATIILFHDTPQEDQNMMINTSPTTKPAVTVAKFSFQVADLKFASCATAHKFKTTATTVLTSLTMITHKHNTTAERDAEEIIFHPTVIKRINILPNSPNNVIPTRLRILPSTVDSSPASSKTTSLHLSYQPKLEGKENDSYKPHPHSQTNQVIMTSLIKRNHRNTIKNIDNFLFDDSKKKKNRHQ